MGRVYKFEVSQSRLLRARHVVARGTRGLGWGRKARAARLRPLRWRTP
jgi:hypothetical protein